MSLATYRKRLRRRWKKAGMEPGALVHMGEIPITPVEIHLIEYDDNTLIERDITGETDFRKYLETSKVSWINITGIHDFEKLTRLAHDFGIHPLVLEDIVNTDQRPKIDEFENTLYIVIRMLHMKEEPEAPYEIQSEQISMVLRENVLLTFQEREEDIFNPLRQRLRNRKGHIRRLGADYLAYALMDSVVDQYFRILESLGEQLETLNEELIRQPGPGALNRIHTLRNEIIYLRKSIWPLREVAGSLQRGTAFFITDATRLYLRDLHDHIIYIMDTVENYREVLSGMLDIYLSSISFHINSQMKVLSIFAALFLPLTFVTGIYGMNFEYMPGLGNPDGFWLTLGAMGIIAGTMVAFFWRKHWL